MHSRPPRDHNACSLPNQNFYAQLSARWTDAAAVAFAQSDGVLRYGQIPHLVGGYAAAMEELGVNPGDRVSVQVDKSLANVALFLAAVKIGAIYNPLNMAYTPAELDYFLEDAEPSLLVVTPERREELGTIARRRGVGNVLTLDASGGDLADMAAMASDHADPATPACPRAARDPAAILYTSGTTGRSKGAVISHGNLASNIASLHDLWAFSPEDALIHALPIFHVHGLFTAMCTALYANCTMLWLPSFDLDRIMALLPEATVLMGVPTYYTRLLSRRDFDCGLTRRMRLFISGSAPLLADTHRQFAARTGHVILERYGMTECGMIASNPYRGERIAGTVGYALPGVQVRVTREDGNVAEPGETGMIEVKGPSVCEGYWRRPEINAVEFARDSYFVTGDLGSMSRDGRLSITGRAKDLIISGGFNVYPKEIEDELDRLDGVRESAVIGAPHPDLGEGVVAVCVRAPGREATEAGIIAALAGRLARFKTPRRVFFVDDLPRNALGKVQKVELRARHRDAFAAG